MTHQAHDKMNESDEITLKCANDLPLVDNMARLRIIRISKRFFGSPGSMSPTWKQRMQLMKQLGSMGNLEELIIEGTIMGQVIPGETLALAIPKRLKRLQVDSGMILDDMYSSKTIARALQDHKHLEDIVILNFANHATDEEDRDSLLDPLVRAAASISSLRTFELSCIASFIPWGRSYMNDTTVESLFSSQTLKRINLTNLGLDDQHFSTIAAMIKDDGPLNELILNGNYNSKLGLETMIRILETNRSLSVLEVVNDVKLDENSFCSLRRNLEQNTVIQSFVCSYKVNSNHQSAVDVYLRMNRLGLRKKFFDPMATPYECVNVLAEVNNDVGCLMYLLREKPSLCNLDMNSFRAPKKSSGVANHLFSFSLLVIFFLLLNSSQFVDAASFCEKLISP